MKNLDIRIMAKSNGIYLWQIANYLGISEATLCRWLRFDITPDRRSQIEDAISNLSQRGDRT